MAAKRSRSFAGRYNRRTIIPRAAPQLTDHAASQFGLLTSLCAFPGSILAGFSGFAIERTGFTWFFIWTSLIGLPVALLAIYVWVKIGISDEAAPQSVAAH